MVPISAAAAGLAPATVSAVKAVIARAAAHVFFTQLRDIAFSFAC
jgi:hypothetical protein